VSKSEELIDMPAEIRQKGIAALRAGQFADAAKYLSGFISDAPNDNEARLAFALALSGRGDHDKALIHLNKLLTKVPRSANLHFQRGQVLERANRKDQALLEFNRTLELDPKHVKARAKMGVAKIPANVGFELVEEEPGYEVVEEEVFDREEFVMAAHATIDDDYVITADLAEEDLLDLVETAPRRKKKENLVQTIIKYVVLAGAVVGGAILSFFWLSSELATILTICAAVGAVLLIVADMLRRRQRTSVWYWAAHLGGLFVIIGGVAGVMIAHRLSDDQQHQSLSDQSNSADNRSSEVKAYQERMQARTDSAVDQAIADLGSSDRGHIIGALNRLRGLPPNAKRNDVAALIETHLQSTDNGILTAAGNTARTWGTEINLDSLRRLAKHSSRNVSQAAKDAIAAIEKSPKN